MSKKVTVINQEREPIMLSNGEQVGSAYTPEASREVELSEDDHKRYVQTGRLAVVEHTAEKVIVDIPAIPVQPHAPAKATTAPATSPDADAAGRNDRRSK